MVTLEVIRATLAGYRPSSSAQADVKAALATIISQDPQPSNEECINTLRDDLPPEVLYSTELLKGPTTLFRILRDYLAVKGLTYSPHPRSNRIAYGLVDMFFTDVPDRIIANANLSANHSSSTSPSVNHSNQSSQPTSHLGMDSKIAHNIASRFKREERYSGKIGEDINEVIDNYCDAADDYNLNEDQKLRYFHNVFDGEAKRFYRTSIAGSEGSFDSAVRRMLQEFNSITRQNRVRKLLQNLRLSQILKTKNCSVSEALEELRETITRYTPQGPQTHRSDLDKTEYLHDAVIGIEWAKAVLTQSLASTPPWTFQQMYTALDASWLQEQKQNESRKRDSSRVPSIMPTFPATHFQRQSTYGIPRRPGSSSSNPRGNFSGPRFKDAINGKDRFGNVRCCHNCGSKYHFIRECPKPASVIRNVRRMIKARPNHVKDILFELSNQVEDIMHHNDTSSEDLDSRNASNGNESQHSDDSVSVTDSDTDEIEESANNHVKNESYFDYATTLHRNIDPSDF